MHGVGVEEGVGGGEGGGGGGQSEWLTCEEWGTFMSVTPEWRPSATG